MSDHTPLPWHLEKDEGQPTTAIGEEIAIIGGEETGEGVRFVLGRFCDFGPHGNEQTEANAKLIHRAVNAHDDLLEALHRLLNFGNDDCICEHMTAEHCLDAEDVCPACDARAAIAKAGGQSNG
jgi:hypothetical protein